jgi:hypothetical protein
MWGFLKNLPIPLAALLLGAILFILGIQDKPVTVGSINIQLTQNWARILSSTLGVLTLISGFVITVILKRIEVQSSAPAKSKEPSKQSVEAQDFFTTVTGKVESFEDMVQGANQLYILSITSVNLLNQHYEIFEELGRTGCELRFLFLNPDSEYSKWTYGGNPEVFRNNINTTIRSLNKLKPIFGNKLKVHIIEYAPPIGIILVEKKRMLRDKYFAHVQLYFLRGAIGSNRPVFRVNYDDKWFETFKKEFDDLWKESKSWGALKTNGSSN